MTAVSAVCLLSAIPVFGADSASSGNSTSAGSSSSSTVVSPDALDGAPPAERHLNLPDPPLSIEDLFARRRSPGPMGAPRRSAPIERPRQLLDDKDWGLMTPDDIVKDYMAKQGFQMPDFAPDGRDRSSMSAMERFYDRQNHSKAPGSNAREGAFNPGNLFDNAGQSPIGGLNGIGSPGGLNVFGPNGIRSDALSEVLGMRNNSMTPGAIREREANQQQMDAFKRALDFQPALPGAPSAVAAVPQPPASSGRTASGNLGFVMPRNPFDAAAGTYNSTLATAVPTAPVAPVAPTAPGQPLPSIVPAYTHTAPPKLDFSIPKRHF